MCYLRSSASPVSLQGILEVSTIRSDRSVNDQLGPYKALVPDIVPGHITRVASTRCPPRDW